MKAAGWLAVGGLLVVLTVCHSQPSSAPPAQAPVAQKQPAEPFPFEVAGRTQCIPGRKAEIAPVPLHPVVEILAVVGDRVKKEQPLVKLDDDEPKADVRAKKAALESAKILLKEAKRYLAKMEEAYERGALPEASYFQARTAVLKAEQDERAAEAALAGSEAELEHYTIVAMIDGVVSRLDVHLGTVSRPGTTIWGEILDLSEIGVRCEVTVEQADLLAPGQVAEIRFGAKQELIGTAKIVTVGITAEPTTGTIAVVVRLANEQGRLRCGVPVRVKFLGTKPKEAKD
jgi:multidrug efflux system membrane fusion protein